MLLVQSHSDFSDVAIEGRPQRALSQDDVKTSRHCRFNSFNGLKSVPPHAFCRSKEKKKA